MQKCNRQFKIHYNQQNTNVMTQREGRNEHYLHRKQRFLVQFTSSTASIILHL